MNLEEYDISQPLQARVTQTKLITPPDAGAEVRDIELNVPPTTVDYQAGKSIGVLAPGPHAFGNRRHLRLYTIARLRPADDGGSLLSICVRRCFYIDEVNGERYPGVASNLLCDARPGDVLSVTGPYGHPFSIPRDPAANILLIGSGTGIAPFRAFAEHIQANRQGWGAGKVRLYYGPSSGMETLYRNDVTGDIANYYLDQTFQAFRALGLDDSESEGREEPTIARHAEAAWTLMQDNRTHVYLAGLGRSLGGLDRVMARVAGSDEAWAAKKKELTFFNRWTELVYD